MHVFCIRFNLHPEGFWEDPLDCVITLATVALSGNLDFGMGNLNGQAEGVVMPSVWFRGRLGDAHHLSEEATRGHSQGSLQRPAYLYIQHAAAATAAAGRAPLIFFFYFLVKGPAAVTGTWDVPSFHIDFSGTFSQLRSVQVVGCHSATSTFGRFGGPR